jgi:uncharacterized damage-inducible protein DinB
MKWQQLVLDSYRRQSRELEQVLEGLTEEDLNRQPAPDCNSIGWLAWHVVRGIDRNMSELMGEEQLWIKEKWHARFGREPDPSETGLGHTTEQAREFRSPAAIVIIDYQKSILSRVEEYINTGLTETDLAREVYSPTLKSTRTVEEVLVGQFWHCMHHVGEAGYTRGLLKGKGWYEH